jgi:hypothetical protein
MKTSIILVTALLTSHAVGAAKQSETQLRHPRELQRVGTPPRDPDPGGRYGRRSPVSKGKGSSDGDDDDDDDDGVRMHQSDVSARSTVFP